MKQVIVAAVFFGLLVYGVRKLDKYFDEHIGYDDFEGL